MTSPYVCGPAFIYAGVSGGILGKQPVFLGTCEETPSVRIEREWEPLYNALGGSRIPSDTTYQGEVAHVRCDLTKYSEAVYAVMSALPSWGLRGLNTFGDLGALMVSEGGYHPLWVVFPYANKLTMVANLLPQGYRFYATWLENDDLGPLSTRPRKLSLVWTCQRVFNQQTLAWGLYDHNCTGLPPIN